jgi:putative transposase
MRRVEASNGPRFVTFSTYQRAPFLADTHERESFVTELMRARQEDGFLIHAFVVMPEHIHLVVTPQNVVLAKSLANMKRRTARAAFARWRDVLSEMHRGIAPDGSTRFWQRGGGYDRNVRDQAELAEKVTYTESNPVCRGLVATPDEWRWSSAFVRTKRAPDWWAVDRID